MLEDFEGVVEAGGNRISATEWQAAEAQREDRLALGKARGEIPGPHRQLVEIGQGRKAGSIQLSDGGHLRSLPGFVAFPNVTRFGVRTRDEPAGRGDAYNRMELATRRRLVARDWQRACRRLRAPQGPDGYWSRSKGRRRRRRPLRLANPSARSMSRLSLPGSGRRTICVPPSRDIVRHSWRPGLHLPGPRPSTASPGRWLPTRRSRRCSSVSSTPLRRLSAYIG